MNDLDEFTKVVLSRLDRIKQGVLKHKIISDYDKGQIDLINAIQTTFKNMGIDTKL